MTSPGKRFTAVEGSALVLEVAGTSPVSPVMSAPFRCNLNVPAVPIENAWNAIPRNVTFAPTFHKIFVWDVVIDRLIVATPCSVTIAVPPKMDHTVDESRNTTPVASAAAMVFPFNPSDPSLINVTVYWLIFSYQKYCPARVVIVDC